LLGITEQLIGSVWLDAPPFRYAGNVGPMELSLQANNLLCRIGEVIGERCGLLGLFGVDFIFADGVPWLVEVNPRYPASVEVLEAVTGLRALANHAAAFESSADGPDFTRVANGIAGKAILYATRRVRMPEGESY